MTRAAALLGSLTFLALAPGTVAGVVPYWLTRWQLRPAFLGSRAGRIAGVVLVAAGVTVLVDSFVRFAVRGLGTPAPVAPPSRLVVTGVYRRVRNPMYVAILSLVFGQAMLFGSGPLLGYGFFLWLAFHAFVVGYEEPALRRKFGAEYDAFRASVPRWLPRVRAWRE